MIKAFDKTWLPELPKTAIQHVISHWTAGNIQHSQDDLNHYHFVIDYTGEVFRGTHSIMQNARPFYSSRPYAAHTLNFNAGAVGIAVCGMMNARQNPTRLGGAPINQVQWIQSSYVAACVCAKYGVPTTTYTGVMQHGEVQARTGVKQRGKWDVNVLPWDLDKSAEDVQRQYRLMVGEGLAEVIKGSSLATIDAKIRAVMAAS